MSSSAFKKNHILTSALLERFADNDGKILRHDLQRGKVVPRKSGLEGFRKHMWTKVNKVAIEKLWNKEAEGAMGRIFSKIDAQKGLTLKEARILATFIAIHYVRSNEFIRLYEQKRQREADLIFRDSKADLANRYILRARWLQETRIPSVYFENTLRDLYVDCRDYIVEHGIEIGVALNADSFILSDAGVVISNTETNRLQPSGGTSIKDANNALMALGPKLVASLSSRSQKVSYRTLRTDEVNYVNELLKKGSIQVYYSTTCFK